MNFNKVLSFIVGKPVGNQRQIPVSQLSAHKRAVRRQNLLRHEAQVESTVFGPIPAGHQREFFCLDKYTWVWSEQWFNDEAQSYEHMTVRYEFQPNGILKLVNNIPRGYVEGKELKNLHEAIRKYGNKVAVEVYGKAPFAI